jgi:hypothetical protein
MIEKEISIDRRDVVNNNKNLLNNMDISFLLTVTLLVVDGVFNK